MTHPSSPRTQTKPSALYRLSRTWHEWVGLISSVLMCVIALSGIYLNHRDLFNPNPGGAPSSQEGSRGGHPEGTRPGGGRPGGVKLTPQMLEESASFSQALQRVRQEWGAESVMESIMLRRDGRGLVWRFKGTQGNELHLDARSLQVLVNRQGGSGNGVGKLMHDLHTGQILGTSGKIIVDLVALSMVLLTASGLVLWVKPRLARRRRLVLA